MMLLVRIMCRSPDQIAQETANPASLLETKERQNVGLGLTNIADRAYYYFESLCFQCLNLMSSSNLAKHGEEVHRYIYDTIIINEEILKKWLLIFEEDDIVRDLDIRLKKTLMEEAVSIFSRTLMRQSLTDFP